MFYVLNYNNKTFHKSEFPEQISAVVTNLLKNGQATTDDLEIINADDNNHMTVAEFNQNWS